MENAFGILVSQFRVILGTMEQHQGLSETLCLRVVLQNMLRTHQKAADRAPTPASEVAALQNEPVVYVRNEHYRNPSRDAKHQQELLEKVRYLNCNLNDIFVFQIANKVLLEPLVSRNISY